MAKQGARSQVVKERSAYLTIKFASGKELVTNNRVVSPEQVSDLNAIMSAHETFAAHVGNDIALVNTAMVESIHVTYNGPTTTRSL